MKLDKALPKDERILQAAEKIFSMYGYEKATLDEIIALASTCTSISTARMATLFRISLPITDCF